jgi:hypothetical protein
MLVRRLVVVRRCARSLLSSSRHCSSTVPRDTATTTRSAAENNYFDFCGKFPADRRQSFLSGFSLHADFVNEEEETEFIREVDPHLRRHKYETDHWDNVSSRTVWPFGHLWGGGVKREKRKRGEIGDKMVQGR